MTVMIMKHHYVQPTSRLSARELASLTVASLAFALLIGGRASAEPQSQPDIAAAAMEVRSIARSQKAYPRFTDIPPNPKDERPVTAWGRIGREVLTAGQELERLTSPETWTLKETEPFAATAFFEAGSAPPIVSATAEAEAFARDIRRRATPPPPPVR
ncbi:MAG: hypothetical protein ACKOD3_07505 [Phenylobacterium sp.]